MEIKTDTWDRRWGRIALRAGVFALLGAALFANVYLEGNGLISLIIILAAVLLGCFFTSAMYLKIVLALLANLMLVVLAFMFMFMGRTYVSVSAPSPDGRAVAELIEVPAFGEHHFVVRLKTKDGRGNPRYRDLFRSPDEEQPEAECFLWSRDGRYLLLLGTRFLSVRSEAYLASGERLYLLVDTKKDVVYYNTTQVRPERPFTVDDLAEIDFGVSMTRGTVTNARESSHRKVCTPRLEN